MRYFAQLRGLLALVGFYASLCSLHITQILRETYVGMTHLHLSFMTFIINTFFYSGLEEAWL